MAYHDTVLSEGGAEPHVGPTFNAYLVIFGALAVFTLLSFLVNLLFGQHNFTGAAIIMIVAVCKALLVALYFMHLKFDWRKLYYIVTPLMILTVMMIVVLLPDFVVDAHRDALDDEAAATSGMVQGAPH
jgi:caa(3)-type oxidase subunit IV